MDNAARKGAELAVFAVEAKTEEVVFGAVDAFGGVDEELDGAREEELGLASGDSTVAVFFDDAVGEGGLDEAAGLHMDDFGFHRLPDAVLILVVDADFVDGGEDDLAGRRR